jgi:titin
MSLSLGSGTYYLSVMSEGNYGDVGQYTITGTVPAAQGVLAAPSGLVSTMSPASSQVNLSWTDTSTSESGFSIQRSDDGGLTWLDVASVGANVTTYQSTEPGAGCSSQFRVYAFDATTTSDFSNAVTVWGPPIAPSSVAAKAASATQVSVSWSLVNSATGYLLQRSTDGVNWSAVATVTGASYQDGNLSSNVTYYYRVAASNAGGMSGFSAAAAATTMISPVPAAPSNLVATRLSKGKIQLTWSDNSSNETGFQIEYSTGGGAWKVLVKKAAGTTSYTGSFHIGTLYSFRVCAYNAYGNSAYTGVAQAVASRTAASKSITQTTVKATPFSEVTIAVTGADDSSLLKSKHGKVFKAA